MSLGCTVSRQKKFCKMHSLICMCCIIIQALLPLLKVSFLIQNACTSRTGFDFCGPRRNRKWLVLDSAPQNHRQKHCAMLQSTLSMNRHWMRCSVVICYLNMLSQICVCNRSHGRDYETEFSTEPLQCEAPIGNNERRKNNLFLVPY